jgi:molybdopterin-binding protein
VIVKRTVGLDPARRSADLFGGSRQEARPMKISARNVLKGTVTDVKTGPVNSQVKVDIGGGNVVTSMITSDAAADIEVEVGKEVYVVIKASEVMLATD